MRIIKYFIITILISIGTAFYLLCTTPAGLQYDLQWLGRLLPRELKIEKVSGALLNEFSLQNISYRTPEQLITIKTVDVVWNPMQLLRGKIVIEKLLLADTKIKLSETITSENKLKKYHIYFLRNLSVNHIFIHQLQVEQSKLLINLNGELTDNWDIQWDTHIPKLNMIFSDITGSLDNRGTISGPRLTPTINAHFKGNQLAFGKQKINKITGEANVFIKSHANSSIKLTASGINIHDYFFNKLELGITGNVAFEKKSLNALLIMSIAKQPPISTSITLPNFSGFPNPNQLIVGKMEFNLNDLSNLTYFIPNIRQPRGTIHGKVNLAGTLSEPKISGELTLKNGNIFIPKLGIHPENITLQAILDNNKIVNITGNFQSGSGTGTLQGNINLNETHFPLALTVKGNNLQAVYLSEYKAIISPDLNFHFTYPKLELQGSIDISNAEIIPKNFGETKTLPDEVVFINQPQPSINSSLDTLLKIHLNLGDKVNLIYDNLQARVGGKILITKDFNSPTTAKGELFTLQGRYSAYGQKLVIDTGRLIYTGNILTNPGLDIRAAKKVRRVLTSNASDFSLNAQTIPIYAGIETTKVGIQVTGTANHPQISLFSIPADLSQGDILSYLILGYPQSHASNSQGAALLSVLTSLNPNGGKIAHITEKFQQKFGLTELNVASVQSFNPISKKIESTTSFIVGKQITDKLSVHYSIGLFDPVSILNLRYQINNHWAVQSETSTIDNGADLVYVFERD